MESFVRSALEATGVGVGVGVVGVTEAFGSFLQEEAKINKLNENINNLSNDFKFILFNIYFGKLKYKL
jgi:hypothetical protein